MAGKFGDWVLISVYGYPSRGYGVANRALVQEVRQWVMTHQDCRIVLGGDWNMDPEEWAPGGNGDFCHVLDPKLPTCKGNTLDYLAVNHKARHAVLTWSVDKDNAQATHATSRVALRGSLQAGRLGLWAPKSLPDRLIGCLRDGWEANLLRYPSRQLAV